MGTFEEHFPELFGENRHKWVPVETSEHRVTYELREIAARIAAMDPGTFDSEVAPDWVCFFCGTQQAYDFKADRYLEGHANDCDLVALRDALLRDAKDAEAVS